MQLVTVLAAHFQETGHEAQKQVPEPVFIMVNKNLQKNEDMQEKEKARS